MRVLWAYFSVVFVLIAIEYDFLCDLGKNVNYLTKRTQIAYTNTQNA